MRFQELVGKRITAIETRAINTTIAGRLCQSIAIDRITLNDGSQLKLYGSLADNDECFVEGRCRAPRSPAAATTQQPAKEPRVSFKRHVRRVIPSP